MRLSMKTLAQNIREVFDSSRVNTGAYNDIPETSMTARSRTSLIVGSLLVMGVSAAAVAWMMTPPEKAYSVSVRIDRPNGLIPNDEPGIVSGETRYYYYLAPRAGQNIQVMTDQYGCQWQIAQQPGQELSRTYPMLDPQTRVQRCTDQTRAMQPYLARTVGAAMPDPGPYAELVIVRQLNSQQVAQSELVKAAATTNTGGSPFSREKPAPAIDPDVVAQEIAAATANATTSQRVPPPNNIRTTVARRIAAARTNTARPAAGSVRATPVAPEAPIDRSRPLEPVTTFAADPRTQMSTVTRRPPGITPSAPARYQPSENEVMVPINERRIDPQTGQNITPEGPVTNTTTPSGSPVQLPPQ